MNNLEKRGTKLYSPAPLPFLLLLLRVQASAEAVTSAPVLDAITAGCANTALGASTTFSAASETAKTASTASVSFRGMDGEGVATPDFAHVDIEKAVMTNRKEKDQTWEKLAALTRLESTISCEADKTENLRNGDKIKITVSYDKDLAKELGVSFKDLSKYIYS